MTAYFKPSFSCLFHFFSSTFQHLPSSPPLIFHLLIKKPNNTDHIHGLKQVHAVPKLLLLVMVIIKVKVLTIILPHQVSLALSPNVDVLSNSTIRKRQ